MAKRAKKEKIDLTTEEKIKNAALKLFTKKGFAATRTRDISEEAGINLALLNYYFRSKEKLFELVMVEVLQNFFRGMTEIFNDEGTTMEAKIRTFVGNYTELLKRQPDLPLFIFHELRLHPQKIASKIGLDGIFRSYFLKQLQHEIDAGRVAAMNPLHYIINMVGLCVFPFIAAPVLRNLVGINQDAFMALMDERKVLVPQWLTLIMKGGTSPTAYGARKRDVQ